MPIGFFRSPPKVGIDFVDKSYRFGDDLNVRVSVRVEKPGFKIRHAVVQLIVDHRFQKTREVPVYRSSISRSSGGLHGNWSSIGDMNRSNELLADEPRLVTEQRVETAIQDEQVILENRALMYRVQSFDADFRIAPPDFKPQSESSFSYFVRLRMDLPRMPDINLHRTVRVEMK